VFLDFDTNGMEARAEEYNEYEKGEGIECLFAMELLINNSLLEIDKIISNAGISEISSVGITSRKLELEELWTNMHILGKYPSKLKEELYDGYDLEFSTNINNCYEDLSSVKLSDFSYIEDGSVISTMSPKDKLDSIYSVMKDYCIDLDNASLESLIGLYRVTKDEDYKAELEEQLRQRLRALHNANSVGPKELEDLFPYFDMEELIARYEADNPQDVAIVNDWIATDSDNNLTETDNIYIKYYLYTAPEKYRKITILALPNIPIQTTSLELGPSHYSSYSAGMKYSGVYLRYQSDFLYDPKGKYTTSLHEIGHGIDFSVAGGYSAGTAVYTQEVILSPTAQLPENGIVNTWTDKYGMHVEMTEEGAIYYDVYYNENNPHSVISIANDLVVNQNSLGNVEVVVDALYNGTDKSSLSATDILLYDAVVKKMQSVPKSPDYEAVTDVYGGASGNLLTNKSGYKHTDEYWQEANNPNNDVQGKELWAEYYSYVMTGDSNKINITKEYFPTATVLLEGYIDEIGE